MTDHIPEWDELFPGTYNAGDFDDGIVRTLTIRWIQHEDLPEIGGNGKPTGNTVRKPVLLFEEVGRRLVLNKTNQSLIGALLGKRTKQWIGKRITLAQEANVAFGKPGIRVVGSPDIDRDIKHTPGLMPTPKRVYTLTRTVLAGTAGAPAVAPTLAQALGAALLTESDLDAYRASIGKPPCADLTDEYRAGLARWLTSDDNAARVRAFVSAGGEE